MLGSIPYRYLKGKYGVISGSGAQAQNGNDARWNSAEIFAPLCVFFFLITRPGSRRNLTGFAREHYSFLMSHASTLCPALKFFRENRFTLS
jgi:hypothetical protein